MRPRKRKLIDIAKQLLLNSSFRSVAEVIAEWKRLTDLSKSRYYVYEKLALAELDEKQGDSSDLSED